jgi:hypothetical protein
MYETSIQTGTNKRCHHKEKTALHVLRDCKGLVEHRFILKHNLWSNYKVPVSKVMKSDVLTAVKMSTLVFWVAKPAWLLGKYQRFRKKGNISISWAEDGDIIFL